ncbi:methyl-accepting chemotaxis protein [Archangium lansingense]|uniref:Methyl-accepting chemotaxis protein n=1 Tax=Archangium lansingense TaxID=2995310 RepID=A0ABT4A0W7_9BACT|nr:methyl-accepting chemotaxis protein [Archangium lansinium]MCY1074929.1 methyl-accepting chemotaxis protein [Archangium lansinium]
MPADKQITTIVRKLFITRQLFGSVVMSPANLYLINNLSGSTEQEMAKTNAYTNPIVFVLLSLLVPYLVMNYTVRRAFATLPGDHEGSKLERLLKIPGQLEALMILSGALGTGTVVLVPLIVFNKGLTALPWVMSTVLLVLMLNFISERLIYERILRPFAIEEFHRNPKASIRGTGFFWPRQKWYLPYAFAVFVASTLMLTTTIIAKNVIVTFEGLQQVMQTTPEQIGTQLGTLVTQVVSRTATPLALMGGYLLIIASVAAWLLARRQEMGAKSVQEAIEGLASGSPKLPEWISTDEIGDLSSSTARAFEKLSAFSLSLGDSANSLRLSAERLGASANKQSTVLTQQAAALQETQVTAQEIKQTSTLASQKAESVLQQTTRANQISQDAVSAVQSSLEGLQEIGQQVSEMANSIRSLEKKTQQIASITRTVKDLADQSNMLALNAAIEAVRSGEHGVGFGVVAREIRALADQSIRATNSVRSILLDINNAIRSTVAMTAKGFEKVESSLKTVKGFEGNIQQLSGIVRDNADSIRQITVAVTQQNVGISQIFQAVNDLNEMMNQTMVEMQTSEEAANVVKDVADQVSGSVDSYGWKEAAERARRNSQA